MTATRVGGYSMRAAIALAAVSMLVWIAFAPGLDNQLMQTWDTYDYVIVNPHIRELTRENLLWMLSAFYMSNWHPLTWLSHAIDYSLFGTEPFGHHLVSVVIHWMNSLLVFLLTWVLLKHTHDAQNPEQSRRHLMAAATAAALFAVHPQHVESVVWVAERKDVLCAFFSLLTLLGHVRFVHAQGRSRAAWYLATLLSFLLAIMAKPMAVTLPVALLLLDIYPLGRHKPKSRGTLYKPVTGLLVEKLPLFAIAGIASLATLWAQHSAGSVSSLAAYSLDMRVLNAFNSLIFYLSKLLIPVGLSPFYAYPDAADGSTIQRLLASLAAAMAITVLAAVAWRRGHRYWLIAWLFYGVTLAPVLGIIQVGSQAAADRYTYLATLPFMILAGAGFAGWFYRARGAAKARWLATSGLVAVILLLTYQTRQQSDVWQSDISLWRHVVQMDPGNAYGRFRLGDAFMLFGMPGPAVNAYRSAQALDPERLWYGVNLPGALLAIGRYPEALEQVEVLLTHDVTGGRGIDTLLVQKAEALIGMGRMEEARGALREALSINPNNATALALSDSI